MGDVVQFDDRRRIQEEAATWLTRIDRGLGKAEQLELESWLRAEPRHVAAFVELANAWDKLEDLSALSGLVELPPPRSRKGVTARRMTAAAAVLGLAVLGVALLSSGLGLREPQFAARTGPTPDIADRPLESAVAEAAPDSVEFATGTGELRKVTLVDGTIVALNTRSTLSVSFDERHRKAYLQGGEATFEVAHDANRPFVVEAAGNSIRAVGTIFTVRARSKSSVSVLVSEGRVAVSTSASADGTRDPSELPPGARTTRLLEAGDRLEMIGGDVQFERMSLADIDDALAWQNGMIVFQGDPLVDALGEVSRYSDARFALADEGIGETRVAGVFQVKDVDGFVDSLRVNLGIGARQLPDGTLLLFRL